MNELQKNHLLETAKWQKFLGVLMAIGTVIMFGLGIALMFFGNQLDLDEFGELANLGSVGGAVMGVVYLLGGLIYFFFTLYLLRSANNLKAWGRSDDEEALTKGLKNNKSYFKLNGILAIISLVLIALVIVGVVIAAIAAA